MRNEGRPLSHGACEGAAAAAGFLAGGIQTEFSVQSIEFGGMGLTARRTFAKKQFEHVKPRISEIDVKVELLNERPMEFLFYMRQQRPNILTVARYLFEQASPPRVCTSSCAVAFLLDASQCGRLPSMCGTLYSL